MWMTETCTRDLKTVLLLLGLIRMKGSFMSSLCWVVVAVKTDKCFSVHIRVCRL